MYYSVIGILSFLVLIIENRDTLFTRNHSDKQASFFVYRRFLSAVAVYYILDALWGVLEYFKLSKLLFIDTSFYFVVMAVGVLFWTKFTVTYLEEDNIFVKFLLYSGRIFSVAVTILVIVNCFKPVFFSVDEDCVYHAFGIRYITLIVQIALLLLISVNSLTYIFIGDKDKMHKYSALALFGIIMATLLLAQVFYPYLPLYAIGYLLGTSILHSFVISDERKLAKKIVIKDALTEVGNKYAFDVVAKELNKKIENREDPPFAIVVCDINDLKIINDTKGHIVGDAYIKDACKIICDVFKHSQVFRIGGDEFVVVCRDHDYEKISELLNEMDAQNTQNHKNSEVQIAYGMARWDNDTDVQDVFHRADKKMYEHKIYLKAKNGKETAENI